MAHLLRVLQETVEWNLPRGKLPPCVESALIWAENKKVPLHETLVVEETIFQVMDTLMSVYGLKHMYWPGKFSSLQCAFDVFMFSPFPISNVDKYVSILFLINRTAMPKNVLPCL